MKRLAALLVATAYGALWSLYRAGTILVAASILVSVASSCATLTPTPYTDAPKSSGNVVTADVSSIYKDPVNVRFYCNGGLIKTVRWLMQGNTETVDLHVGRGCDFRLTIEAAITGSRYTKPEGYDSGRHLHAIGHEGCRKLTVRAGVMLPSSFTMPSECRR